MRKLVYVGYNEKIDEIIETTSFDTMQECKGYGYKFTERLDEIEEEKKIDKEKIAKRQAAIRKGKR